MPLLVLPAVTPVMLGGTRAFEAALDGAPGDGWPWVQLLGCVRGARRRARRPGLRAAAGGIVVNLKVLSIASAVSSRSTIVLALVVAPADAIQGDAYRLLYLHVPSAWLAYLAFFVTAVASVLWLWPRTRSTTWDLLAGASAEVGVIFTGLTLVDGVVLGSPDLGHLVGVGRAAHDHRGPVLPLPRLPRACAAPARPPTERGKRCAIAALIAFADVPIVHFSVTWWQTLHQDGTVFNENLDVAIHGF